MSKIEQKEIPIEILAIKRVRLTKLSDDVFEGKHPNGIHAGWVEEGRLWKAPIVGERCVVGRFHTSTVTEIIDENTFKTKNSTYKIEEVID